MYSHVCQQTLYRMKYKKYHDFDNFLKLFLPYKKYFCLLVKKKLHKNAAIKNKFRAK